MKRLAVLIVLILLAGAAMFSEARADRAVRFFESLKHTKGQFYQKPFHLLPWQTQIVRDVYGSLRPNGSRLIKYVYVEIPKKNGKSELCAGAGLYHTFADGERNGEVYGCAADRSQASIVFDVAVDMVDQLPALQKRTKLQISKKRFTDKVSGTFYQVLSAEAFTKHGINLSACIFDELHAQPNRELWDVMTFGAGDARLQPIWWIITTAGDDPDRVSVGWEQHEYAAKLLAGEIVDSTWYPVIYGYEPPNDEKPGDIYDESLWQRVNPSLGTTITLESVREAAEKAKVKPADERLFRWLRLNQWVTTKLTTWLPLDLFDRNVGQWSRADLVGRDCYMGLDLSSTTDLTALTLVFPPQADQLDWRVIFEAWIPEENMVERVKNDHVPYDQWAAQGWVTPTPGDVVDYTRVEERILALCKLYNVIELCSDRAMAAMLLQRLEAAAVLCVDIPQTFASLTDPMNQVEILLRNWKGKELEEIKPVQGKLLAGKMTLEPSLVARWAFGNTSIAKNGQGYIKFVKEHRGKSVVRTKRIDPISALIDAMARARYYSGPVDISAQILDDEWGM